VFFFFFSTSLFFIFARNKKQVPFLFTSFYLLLL